MKLACLLSQTLQGHCADLNAFLRGTTLQAFANKMCEAGIITVDLRDNPVYNLIEGQLVAIFNIVKKKEQFEKYCKDFLSALRSLHGPLEVVADGIRDEWTQKVSVELHLCLNL